MCSCHSIPECCVMFSGVKLSMGLFIFLHEHCSLYSFHNNGVDDIKHQLKGIIDIADLI